MEHLSPSADQIEEYMPGALGEFITPSERELLTDETLGKEVIVAAMRRTKIVELPQDLEDLIVAGRPASSYIVDQSSRS